MHNYDQIFFTVPEVARRWNVSLSFVRRLLAKGDLKKTYFGRSVRIAEQDVERYERAAREGRYSKAG